MQKRLADRGEEKQQNTGRDRVIIGKKGKRGMRKYSLRRHKVRHFYLQTCPKRSKQSSGNHNFC